MNNKDINNTRTMKYLGEDDWNCPVYKCVETNNKFNEVNYE